ncbi:LLM class flavin-dependent oxidoreductase [Burkholderia vietnamiensis]|uniref:LLM class flavin-dependent oxidoreductase n=1 Tax=Burkholderia vietnamiensis TaxID=60552 RepID=UPI001BA092DC|nr:LLM class flavin-dependent oxidoreductase [Burkholderia vietnamiensis]MBR8230247.1 LLM class flavin-dependent oxidoreductase [Burkholderia vietnamiensis]
MSAPRLLLRLDTGYDIGSDTGCNTTRRDLVADWIAIAEAGVSAGCDAILLPVQRTGPDPWMAAAALVDALPALRVMVTLQAGAMLPIAAAHLAQSLQSLSRGRACLALEADVPDVDATDRAMHLNRDQRLARSAEFLSILRVLWATESPLQYRGTYYRAEHARLPDLAAQRPPVYWSVAERHEIAFAASWCDGLLVPASAPPLAAAVEHAYRACGLAPPPAGVALRRMIRFDAARRARAAQRANRRRGDA